MGKILSLVLGLSVLGFLAYKTMYGRNAGAPGDPAAAPTERLQNVREAARNIEKKDDARLENAEKGATAD